MTAAALGVLAGVGLLLVASPFLWPNRAGNRMPRPAVRAFRARLALAGLPQVGVPVFLVVSAIVGLAVAAGVFAVVPVLVLAVAAGLVGCCVPALVVNWRARAARRATRVVWPDVVDQLVSAVRSGMPLPEALATLATAGPTLTRPAFAAFEADHRATGDYAGCINRLKDRLADPIADRILETLRMSREVGGTELVSVLRGLSGYLREETAIRAELEARQSWIRNAARLGVAAPWVVLVLLSTRPEAAAAYNSTAGVLLVIGGLGLTVVAYRIMLGLGQLPEERRWFG
ncbi:type II secretion system F family protein [Diaminobutyricimonas sp. TR449]|uniref:type II secretion system F family protein n=1 Tax=Diaminobutyricimonas sp. TR449 TaxID=2708076 RepID=UPI001FB8C005|nr:type II secretion system F family protein [Diaminobutyricimonas sp. TR449]